jgi:hypothetical protein
MGSKKSRSWLLAVGVIVALATPAAEAGKGGNGKGKGSGDPGSGDAGGIQPVVVTFRDSFLTEPPDRLGSDCGGGVVTPDPPCPYEDGVDDVQAFVGSKANYGNLFLRVVSADTLPIRSELLDLTDCVSSAESCVPPFGSSDDTLGNIKVDVNDSITDGLYALAKGEMVSAPMRIYLNTESGLWGFLDFGPGTGKHSKLCSASTRVTATRTGDATNPGEHDRWQITAGSNAIACLLTVGGDFAGYYGVPFEMTVVIP